MIGYAIVIGAWGFLFCNVLTDEDEVFYWLRCKFDKILDNPYKNPIGKILYTCAKCHAGQVACWSFPLLFSYSIINHFAFIVVAMFTAFYLDEKL